jgi:hypothetical protein
MTINVNDDHPFVTINIEQMTFLLVKASIETMDGGNN